MNKCHHGVPLNKECVSIQCDQWNHTKHIPKEEPNKVFVHIPGCLLEHNAPCTCPEIGDAGKFIAGLLQVVETILDPSADAKRQFDSVEYYKYIKNFLKPKSPEAES